MKSCWKRECKGARKGEKALIQYLKSGLVCTGCYSVSSGFCHQITTRTKCHISFFYEGIVKENRIKKSEEKISWATTN